MIQPSLRRKALRGRAHISICIDADGGLLFHPEGDPERVAGALRLVVRMFTEHPERIVCTAGGCAHGCDHAE